MILGRDEFAVVTSISPSTTRRCWSRPLGTADPLLSLSSQAPEIDTRLNYRRRMRYLMLIWAEADATGGDESDLKAWVDFDEEVKEAGAFVLNGALAPAAGEARLVQTEIAGHVLQGAVEQRPFAEGKRQIEGFYVMDLPSMNAALLWANRLPTYGCVEVRELLQY